MQNAYAELPSLPFHPSTIDMTSVIAHLRDIAVPTNVKRSTYVIFRNESGNGSRGFNNNFVGAQADGARWPAKFDPTIAGTVTHAENQTGKQRIFVAFKRWEDSVDFLADRVNARGIFIGGAVSHIVSMAIDSEQDLVRAYIKEWVRGDANAEPDAATTKSFLSMYHQGIQAFA